MTPPTGRRNIINAPAPDACDGCPTLSGHQTARKGMSR